MSVVLLMNRLSEQMAWRNALKLHVTHYESFGHNRLLATNRATCSSLAPQLACVAPRIASPMACVLLRVCRTTHSTQLGKQTRWLFVSAKFTGQARCYAAC